MPSQTEENYLKALLALSDENNQVNMTDLSEHLQVSMPTANSMVKKLAEQKFVIYQKYKPLKLTKKGKKEAAMIIRKHRLTEMYLVEKMGFGWEEVHSIAEQVEHIQSPMFFQRMDELLNFPTIDPHGSPIPSRDGEIEWKAYETLSNCNVGDVVDLKALSNSSAEFLEYLNKHKLKLGDEFTILQKEPFDESMTVRFKTTLLLFSKSITEKLLVEKHK